jgi:hypothetical protein
MRRHSNDFDQGPLQRYSFQPQSIHQSATVLFQWQLLVCGTAFHIRWRHRHRFLSFGSVWRRNFSSVPMNADNFARRFWTRDSYNISNLCNVALQSYDKMLRINSFIIIITIHANQFFCFSAFLSLLQRFNSILLRESFMVDVPNK